SLWETRLPDRNRIITSSVEHDSVIKPLKRLEAKGADLRILPVNRGGELDLAELDSLLNEKTLLVSVMLGNNETGILFPVREIASKANQVGAYFHADAACGIGKTAVSFQDLGADFLSFSGHKFYAPKGIGALLMRAGSPFEPFILGGTQERGLRAGT